MFYGSYTELQKTDLISKMGLAINDCSSETKEAEEENEQAYTLSSDASPSSVKDVTFISEEKNNKNVNSKITTVANDQGKILISQEDRQTGAVQWSSLKSWINDIGGCFVSVVLTLLFLIASLSKIGSDWYIISKTRSEVHSSMEHYFFFLYEFTFILP